MTTDFLLGCAPHLPKAPVSASADTDPLLEAAVRLAQETGNVSSSMLQHHLKIGYGRAAKLIDAMVTAGYIEPYNKTIGLYKTIQ